MGFLSIQSLHERVFALLFLGQSRALFLEYAEQFLDEQFESLLNPPLLSHLCEAQAKQDYVCILSSSPDFLVKAFAQKFGVLDHLGSIYEVDKKGNFSQISKVVFGDTKAFFLGMTAKRLNLERSAIRAYSDSILDLPFLEAAGQPIAVNPDAELRKISKERQWPIL